MTDAVHDVRLKSLIQAPPVAWPTLLHHLYPGAPHYNNGPLWRLLERDLREHDLAIQHDFALHPVIYPGTKSK